MSEAETRVMRVLISYSHKAPIEVTEELAAAIEAVVARFAAKVVDLVDAPEQSA